MKSKFLGNLPRFHLWADIILLNASFVIAGSMLFSDLTVFENNNYLNLLLTSNLLWIVCAYLFQNYSFTSKSYNSFGHIVRLFFTFHTHLLIIEIVLYLNGDLLGLKEQLIFLAFQIFCVSNVFTHLAVTFTLKNFEIFKSSFPKYTVITNKDSVKWINRFRENQREIGYHFCGTFQWTDSEDNIEQLERFVEENKVDFVYCSLSEMSNDQISRVLKLAERKKTQIRLIPDFFSLTKELNVSSDQNYPAFHVVTSPLLKTDERLLKRAIDIAFSVVFIVIGLPVFILLAALVKITFKGPVFVKHVRMGRWGKTFNMIRFRTMPENSQQNEQQSELTDLGSPVLGTFLRQSRLRDIPQFFNVLSGEMSMVGPQPLRCSEANVLMEDAKHHFHKALTVKPGLTSIGQIKVRYSNSLSESLHRLKYDIPYLNNYSWQKDLYLMYLTIQVIWLGKGR